MTDLPDTLSNNTTYYPWLPSSPLLVARTSTTPWELYSGAWPKTKELGVVVNHKLNTAWEYEVAPKILACLAEMGVQWTSTDIVRIGVVGESSSSAPIVLWIGVKPGSLSGEEGNTVAFKCLRVLEEFGITDVDVEIRESSVNRTTGPKLLSPVFSEEPTVAVRDPLTYALSLPISPASAPDTAGTGGFFMARGGSSEDLFLVTARHVVLPPNVEPNVNFEHTNSSQPRSNVLLLGNEAYKRCLASITDGMIGPLLGAEFFWRAMKAPERLDTFYNYVKNHWATHTSRILGHIVYAPPIRFGSGSEAEKYTEDFAVIKVDNDKIDKSQFGGNMISLGTGMHPHKFTDKMYPDGIEPAGYHSVVGLLPLQGTGISDDELRRPTSLDKNGDPCLVVVKDGSATGVTVGRASAIPSFIRGQLDDGIPEISKELAILSYDRESGSFSAPGDSGAAVVDGQGRIIGLLTSGTGLRDGRTDISYATPISFIEKRIKAKYPDAHILPGVDVYSLAKDPKALDALLGDLEIPSDDQ